jgi:hypothetical protein
VLIFERYLIATAYRPYAVDTPKTLRHNGLAPSPGSAQKTARRLAGHLLAAVGSQRCSAGWLPTTRRRAASPLPLACCVAGRSFGLAPTRPTWGSGRRTLDRICRIPSARPALVIGKCWLACTGRGRRRRQSILHPFGGREAGRLSRGEGAACWRAKLVTARLAPAAISTPSTVPVAHPIMEATNWLAPGTCPTMAFGFLLFCSPKWVGGIAFANGANRYEIVVAKKARACAAGPRPPTERPARVEPRPWRWPSAGKGPPGFRARALDTAVARISSGADLKCLALKCYGP